MTADADGRGALWGTIVRIVALLLLLAVAVPFLIANGDALAVPVIALMGLGLTAVGVAGLGYWLLTKGTPGRWLARRVGLTPGGVLCGAGIVAVLASIAGLVFLRTSVDRAHSAVSRLDLRAVATAARLTGERDLMESLNQNGIRTMVLLGGLLVLAAVAVGSFRSAALLAMTMGLTGVLVEVLKTSPPQALPVLGVANPHTTSWPSGHAALQASIALGAVLWWWAAGLPRPSIVAAVLVPVAVLVGYSRAFLGIHTLSEVFAGWLVATIAASTTLVADRLVVPRLNLLPAARRWPVLLAGGLAVVVTVVSVHSAHRFRDRGPRNFPPGQFRFREIDRERSQPTQLPAEDPASVLGPLPRYSETMLGGRGQPVGVVVVADGDRFREVMRAGGWTDAAVVTPKDLAPKLASGLRGSAKVDGPIAPTFYDTRAPDFVVRRPVAGNADSRHEAEVWELPLVTATGCSVWAVTTSRYDRTEWDWSRLYPVRRQAADIDTDRDALARSLVADGGFVDAGRSAFVSPGPGSGSAGGYTTDGKVVVLRQPGCGGQEG